MSREELLRLVLDWTEEVLASTDPEDPDSHFNDHARECCEGIAFDERRPSIVAAISALRARANQEPGQ